MGKTCGSKVDVCVFLGSVCLYLLILKGISKHLKILFFVDLSLGLEEILFLLVQGVQRGQDGVGLPLTVGFGLDDPFRVGLGFFGGLIWRGLRFALREKSRVKFRGFISFGRRGGRLSGL